ncbi:hypothetical protein BC629DRAFT_1536363, partial [Irpex lacteus]
MWLEVERRRIAQSEQRRESFGFERNLSTSRPMTTISVGPRPQVSISRPNCLVAVAGSVEFI